MSSHSNLRALSMSNIGIPSLIGYASFAFLLMSSFVLLSNVSGPLVLGHTNILSIFGSIITLFFRPFLSPKPHYCDLLES